FDARLFSQVAATGRYNPDALQALVAGAGSALRDAAAALVPATVEVRHGKITPLIYSRSDEAEVDDAATMLSFRSGEISVAEWIVVSAHPTLIPRKEPVLDPDFPGRLARLREQRGTGVVLVSQGAAGNSTAAIDGLLPE